MSHGYWLAPFGWGIFSVGLIAAIIFFAVKRRFYPVMYVISITTYIFTIGFVINKFDLSKNVILLLLAFSSLVFILLGLYFAHKFKSRKEEFISNIPVKQRR
ncbi:hypothetical protein HYV49_00580 [Candidatus Pacearchaeota archaeon]|nr:hypothetical protein [Candidatus Pacearchaeota archaeon]